jgi:hypothetical protein
MAVAITEEFGNARGQWINYDNYQAADRDTIRNQRHVDIRDFHPDPVVPQTMLELSLLDVGQINSETVGQLTTGIAQSQENWVASNTSFSIGYDGGWDSMPMLQIIPNITGLADRIVTSVTVDRPVDLLTGFEDDDIISIGIPNIVVATFSQANSYIELTSNEDGDFVAGPNAQVFLNQGLSPLADGDNEFRVLRSAFNQNGINLGRITGVRILIQPIYAHNLIINPNGEQDSVGWAMLTTGATGAATSRLNTDSFKGNWSFQASYTSSTRNDLIIKVNEAAGQITPVTPGDVLSGQIAGKWLTGAPTGMRAFIEFLDAGRTFLSQTNGTSVTPNGAWQNCIVENVVAPANAAFATIGISLIGLTIGNPASMRADAAWMMRSPIVRPWFDGDTPGFGWRGAGGASISGPVWRISSMRLLSKDWTYLGVDHNTRTGILQRTPPLTGSLGPIGSSFPIMWRSAEPSGLDDPRPIDAEMGVVFSAGGLFDTNSFTLYFREVTEDFLTQLDLNGTTQASLNGHDQPDLGEAMYNERLQSDLDVFMQDQLEEQQQFTLERSPDYLSASWIQFVCQWQAGSGTVTIVDTEGNGYTFAMPALTAYQKYVFYASIEENEARASIYKIDSVGRVSTKAFDTSTIIDDTAFKRRRGRFGWHADLRDRATYIDSIRTRRTCFAEYRSRPFESVTPVDGAELFVSTSPNIELLQSVAPGPYNVEPSGIVADSEKSLSGSSWRVFNYGDHALQGIQTNNFVIDNFDESAITFDLYVPSTATGIDLLALLGDPSNVNFIELLLPTILYDQWQTVKIDLPFDQNQLTGSYHFMLLQANTQTSTIWIDNLSIYTRSVSWSGRGVTDDAWNSNDAAWTPFKDNLSNASGGVLFAERGHCLQVRARGLTADSHINRVQFKARYAQLGRLVPAPYDVPVVVTTPSWTSTALGGRLVRFDASAALSVAGAYVANWTWSFGDGETAVGSNVTHQYAAAGVYTVTLVTTDNYGRQATYTNTVAV